MMEQEQKLFSIEPHGNSYALYKGRNETHKMEIGGKEYSFPTHGLNLCFLTNFDGKRDETIKLIGYLKRGLGQGVKSWFNKNY